jgi:hypothetical protein
MSKENSTVEERLKKIEQLLNLNKPVYNLHDIALISGYEISYIYKLTHLRAIPHYKPRNGALYFNPTEIIEWCLTNKVPTIAELGEQADEYLIKNKGGKN